MNEEQVMHAMGIDDAYRVEAVLASGRGRLTERVTIDGIGPFIRKKIPQKEADRRVWAALSVCSSPRLPRVALTYEMPDQFVVVYDFIPGSTLGSLVASRGALESEDAVDLATDVCEAVEDLHAHGVIHCDLSPANIIVAADGAHVIDFDIARMGSEASASHGKALGTWGFAAPEQFGFARVDERSDVYAIGRLLAYMLTGDDFADGSYEDGMDLGEAVAPQLRAICEHACAFEPSRRYQSVAELAHALEAFEGGESTCCPVSSGPETAESSPDTAVPAAVGEPPDTAAPLHASRPSARGKRIAALAVAAGLVSIVAIAVLVASGALSLEGLAGEINRQDATRVADGSSKAPGPSSAGGGGDATVDSLESAGTDRIDNALEIEESGWYVDGAGYVQIGFVLANHDASRAFGFPKVTATGRDDAGAVLFADEIVLAEVGAGATVAYGCQVGNGHAPASVEIEVSDPSPSDVLADGGEGLRYTVAGLHEVPDGFGGASFTGEVRQEGPTGDSVSKGSRGSASASSMIAVTVLLRDSKGGIVLGATGYVTPPADDEAAPFEVIVPELPEYATAEASAQTW